MPKIEDFGKIRCLHCGEIITSENVAWRSMKNGVIKPICHECNNIANNKKREKAAKEQKAVIRERKRCGCLKCGDKRHYVLDFHHIDPATKKERVSSMIGRYSTESIIKEIEKCEVLCSNCHRKFHQLESNEVDDFIF